MEKLTLSNHQITNALSSTLIRSNVAAKNFGLTFGSVKTDSRDSVADALFIALRGQQFDGHNYIQNCINQGALGIIGEQSLNVELQQQNIPYWQVSDTTKAYGLIASSHFLSTFQGCCIGITGSSGKTSVKEILKSILAIKGTVLSNEANFNNEIGLPLTLLSHQAPSDYAILEMGARKTNDIHWLSQLAKPHIGIITTIGTAHLESFGSAELLFKTKCELLLNLSATGTAIFDADQPWSDPLSRSLQTQVRTISNHSNSAFLNWTYQNNCLQLQHDKQHIKIMLPLLGKHNSYNAALASAAALSVGLSLADCKAGILKLEPVPGRLSYFNRHHHLIIDDTYNANPEAFKAAVDVLIQQANQCGKSPVLVMGDMFEVGIDSALRHAEIGTYAKTVGIEQLLGIGLLSAHACSAFGQNAQHFSDANGLNQCLRDLYHAPPSVCLFKGSRGMEMEQFIGCFNEI